MEYNLARPRVTSHRGSGTQVMINGAAPLLFADRDQCGSGFELIPTVPVRLSVRAFGYESELIVAA